MGLVGFRVWIWVLGPRPKPKPKPKTQNPKPKTQNPKPKTQRDPDSEFNSLHFCIEINKCLKFVRLKN